MKTLILTFTLTGVVALLAGIGFGWKMNIPANGGWNVKPITPTLPPSESEAALGILLAKTPEEIEKTDIATINWACLSGYPGTEDLHLDAGRARIDQLAQKVKAATDAALKGITAQHPTFKDSPEFRAYMLVSTLQEEFYTAHAVDPNDPHQIPTHQDRPEELFFSGGTSQLTFPIMDNPMLFVAVGQADCLKYPMKVATGKGHFFARWDDGKTRFNIEETGDNMRPRSDDAIRRLYPASDQEIKEGQLFRSMDHAQVFAACLQARGNMMQKMGYIPEASAAYAAAHRFAPDVPLYSIFLTSSIDTWMQANNLDWKVMDQTNADRFNLTPLTMPKETRQ